MLNSMIMVVVTSILASLATVTLAYWFYELRLRRRLEAYVAELADQLEARVKKGVKEAGIELLPAFQEKVEEGFKNAITELPQEGANSIAKVGASLIEDGLSSLFGKRDPSNRKP